ncbi:MAG: manganese efflux pump [Clostridia bacterium]|nr:manganese efflux pump [Clostridia bacterium]
MLGIILMGLGLGISLAMDAFSVSLANGLNEPKMRTGRMCAIAGVFAFFQLAMPMTGWFFVTKVAELFEVVKPFIPWVALVLLCYIGGKMLYESLCKKDEDEECEKCPVRIGGLIVQGIATSIDALSVGFTISDYNWIEALSCCIIIGVLTFGICFAGIAIGKKSGTLLADKAGILGGSILIFIGFEVLISSFF